MVISSCCFAEDGMELFLRRLERVFLVAIVFVKR